MPRALAAAAELGPASRRAPLLVARSDLPNTDAPDRADDRRADDRRDATRPAGRAARAVQIVRRAGDLDHPSDVLEDGRRRGHTRAARRAMSEDIAKKPPRLVSVRELEEQSVREQAGALRSWGSRLLAAELAGDWKRIADVRRELADVALQLEELAHQMETRPRP